MDVDDNDVADADALAFSLSITGGDGTDSGLVDVMSGDAILLRVNGDGDIEGYLANDAGDGGVHHRPRSGDGRDQPRAGPGDHA